MPELLAQGPQVKEQVYEKLVRLRKETSKEFSMAGASGWERWERRVFGCSPGIIELIAVMESTEGFKEGTR